MRARREQHRVGDRYLVDATALLQRVRGAHPTKGLYEAADLQWWWRTPRSTDHLPQLFWFDDLGRPGAAVIATDRGNGIALAPIVMPDATADWVARVVDRGLAHASEHGIGDVDLEVDLADDVMRDVLVNHGFATEEGGAKGSSASLSVVEAWLAADARPDISPLHEGYRLSSRLGRLPRPHHMISRNGPDVEARLRQTSLYRPDLDLVVLDSGDAVAAHALFWFDPQTSTGLVEPMRGGRSPAARTRPPPPHHRRRPTRCGRRNAHEDLLRAHQPGLERPLPQRRLRTRQTDRRVLPPTGVAGPSMQRRTSPRRPPRAGRAGLLLVGSGALRWRWIGKRRQRVGCVLALTLLAAACGKPNGERSGDGAQSAPAETTLTDASASGSTVDASTTSTSPVSTTTAAPQPTTTAPQTLGPGASGPKVEALQRRLAELGYNVGSVDGRYGGATSSAVMAFQKVEQLSVDGVPGAETLARLEQPHHQVPSGGALRIEIDLARQVLFVVDGDETRIFNTSTGNDEAFVWPDGTPGLAYTPTGSFAVYHRIDGIDEGALGAMYRPLYFHTDWAVHGSNYVPAFPASHGCARVSNADQDWIWDHIPTGTTVVVY